MKGRVVFAKIISYEVSMHVFWLFVCLFVRSGRFLGLCVARSFVCLLLLFLFLIFFVCFCFEICFIY